MADSDARCRHFQGIEQGYTRLQISVGIVALLDELHERKEFAQTNEIICTNKDIIAHCYDDPAAPSPGIIEFFLALRKAGVPAEMHVYGSGGHGISFWNKGKPMDEWMGSLLKWKHLHH